MGDADLKKKDVDIKKEDIDVKKTDIDVKKTDIDIKKEDIDVVALLKLLVAVIVDVNKQKGQNVVLTNGNNNEVQIPNEQGAGSVVQK